MMEPDQKANTTEGTKADPSFALSIGERVRAYRARRGIPRKLLSAQSGISERYLAQIETGKANVSIDFLQRLAQAMVVPLHGLLPTSGQQNLPASLNDLLQRLSPPQLEEAYRLLAQHFEPPSTKQSGIALTGIRLGGKTTLGKLLATRLEIPFLRLSQVIETQGGMKVGEVLELGGQRTYRRLERQALEHVIESYPVSILEVGGGLVTEPETFHRLLSRFYTVWLKASPDELMDRLMASGDMRPLEASNLKVAKEDLTRILTERDAEYRRADHILETTGRTVEECLQELASLSRSVVVPHVTVTPKASG